MRVLITSFPSTSHFMPFVPYAWALQAAGHDVCFAAPPGYPTGVAVADFPKVVKAAGLAAVACGQPAPLSMHDGAYPGFAELLPTREEAERYVKELGIDDPADRAVWDVFYHFAMLTIRNYLPPAPRPDIAALVDFARDWKPDLVLWEPWFPCGAIAGRASGAAQARILICPDYTAWAHERFVRTPGGPPSLLAEAMRPLADRYGVEVDEELLLGQWTVDSCPAGLRLPTGVTATVPSRHVPYTGASVRQDWLRQPPSRPRVAMSLGNSARTFFKGDWGRTAKIMEAVDGLDVEMVATLNNNQLLDIPGGKVPGNVRVVDYVPLDQLLPTCSALINHGAIGSFAAAAAKAVPQLICDTDEPTRIYGKATGNGIEWDVTFQRSLYSTLTADYVIGRGAGLRLDHQKQSAEDIRADIQRVVEDPSFQAGAESLSGEWLALPTPNEIVPALERLTVAHRS